MLLCLFSMSRIFYVSFYRFSVLSTIFEFVTLSVFEQMLSFRQFSYFAHMVLCFELQFLVACFFALYMCIMYDCFLKSVISLSHILTVLRRFILFGCWFNEILFCRSCIQVFSIVRGFFSWFKNVVSFTF